MLKSIITDFGVNPNSSTERGVTMMILASYDGSVIKLETLADLGADVNQADNNGKTVIPKSKVELQCETQN